MKSKTLSLNNGELFIYDDILSKSSSDQLLQELSASENFYEYSHKINGRWENTYVPIRLVPTARELFRVASTEGKKNFGKSMIIGQKAHGLKKDGFWFNRMPPGSYTGLHDHKSNAYASGVFYIKVPENSGNIVFKDGDAEVEVESKEGRMILFSSSMKHRVTQNLSKEWRYSIAFNLFTLPLVMDEEEPW